MQTSTLTIVLDSDGARIEPCHGEEHVYDEELDDVRSILSHVCEQLAASAGVRFIVRGFDAEPWPVDVETDLMVVLEQLPEVLAALRDGSECSLDFYEQGIERTLHVRGSGEILDIECVSRDPAWQPSPARLTARRAALLEMLQSLAETFCELTERTCRQSAEHPWFLAWRRASLTSGHPS